MGNYLSFYFTCRSAIISLHIHFDFSLFSGKKLWVIFRIWKTLFHCFTELNSVICVCYLFHSIASKEIFIIWFFRVFSSQRYSVSSRDISVCFLANKIIRTTFSNDLRASKFLRWLKTLSTFPHSINSARVEISPTSFSRLRGNVWKTGKRMRGEIQAEATAACSLVKQTEKSM